MNDTDSSEHAVPGIGKWIAQVGAPLFVSVLVGIGSAAVIGSVLVVRLDERVATLERDVARHEAASLVLLPSTSPNILANFFVDIM